MSSSPEIVYIFWSCRELLEAKTIIRLLLEKELIACASIFPQVYSLYRWQGKVEESEEVKVILKTRSSHFDAIRNEIIVNGSYQVPEIVQVDISKVNPDYLSWAIAETNIAKTQFIENIIPKVPK